MNRLQSLHLRVSNADFEKSAHDMLQVIHTIHHEHGHKSLDECIVCAYALEITVEAVQRYSSFVFRLIGHVMRLSTESEEVEFLREVLFKVATLLHDLIIRDSLHDSASISSTVINLATIAINRPEDPLYHHYKIEDLPEGTEKQRMLSLVHDIINNRYYSEESEVTAPHEYFHPQSEPSGQEPGSVQPAATPDRLRPDPPFPPPIRLKDGREIRALRTEEGRDVYGLRAVSQALGVPQLQLKQQVEAGVVWGFQDDLDWKVELDSARRWKLDADASADETAQRKRKLRPSPDPEAGKNPLPPPTVRDGQEWYGTPAAAEHVGLSDVQISRLAKSGRIRAIRDGKDWLVDLDSLKNWLVTRRRGGARPRPARPTT